MRNAVIVDMLRTPTGRGKPGGALSSIHPVDLLAGVLQHLVARNDLDPGEIEDVIGGCVTQFGQQSANLMRQAVLAAGFPEKVPATTVDRQCGSSQQAIHFGAHAILAGAADIVIACGVESMSRVPMFSNVGDEDRFGSLIELRYPGGLIDQGFSAELICSRWNLSREDLDLFSAQSHERAASASASGAFKGDLLPVRLNADSEQLLSVDETIRPSTTVEDLAKLSPAFYDPDMQQRFPEIQWLVTAGNSSPLSDGASAVLLMNEEKANQLGLEPRARIHQTAVVGDDPIQMLTAIIPATQLVLDRAKLNVSDIDVFEVNEAFACVPLAWQKEFSVDRERLNINGGAISLGHALGSSGTRLMGTLVGALEQRGARYGLQTMCEGGGLANATIIERL
jgi:acetyl-CoA acyltransferase